jgi:transposase, IS5 family
MRKPRPEHGQRQFDTPSIPEVSLNFECRDELIPVLKTLQHIYSKPALRDQILNLVAEDVNGVTRDDVGRKGMDYWQITVLAGVRLGCNLNYDKLQDLAENHRNLRAIMGVGMWDEKTSFTWHRIRDNVCLLDDKTIDAISHLIVAEGHRLDPEAATTTRADSFVMETAVHYPTEDTLILDGIRKIIELCLPIAEEHGLEGWRQHKHLWKRIKRISRSIGRIATRKGANYKKRLKAEYCKLLKQSTRLVRRARELLSELGLAAPSEEDIFGEHTLRAFIARTERVQDTARRRVLKDESVPNEDKLFSVFEPHTQLYKRGKASEPVQFGRLVLVYEDGAGFITHHYVMPRDKGDRDVVVAQTRIVQKRLGGCIKRASFDRGFHSPENQEQLAKIVECLCLPKPGKKQSVEQQTMASAEFHAGVQNHSGVESAIGALQSGNGLERCRDKSELGYERYMSLGVFGRNLHTLGRMLIAAENPSSHAARSRRAA